MPSMKRTAIALLLLATTAMPALALQEPKVSQKDAHTRVAIYDPTDRIHLVIRKGMATNVTFDPMQTIKRTTGINLDNNDAIVATLKKDSGDQDPLINNLPLIGAKVGSTDLIVVTRTADGHEMPYLFAIDVVEEETAAVTYSLTFAYPIQEQQAKVQAVQLTWKQRKEEHDKEVALARLNVDVFYGPQNWAYLAQGKFHDMMPVAIHDNGQITGFRFPGNMAAPAILRLINNVPGPPQACLGKEPRPEELKGDEQAMDTQVVNDITLVHQVAKAWIFRMGEQMVGIGWNCRYDPIGVNPGTGTTSTDAGRTLLPPPKT